MRALAAVLLLAACGDNATPAVDATPPAPDAAPPDAAIPDATPAPRCDNGADDDGDTRIDFPFDPGCDDLADDDETDPATAPDCGDGIDNDEDGLVDYGEDPGCTHAADDDEWHWPIPGCGPSIVITQLDIPSTWSGTLAAAPNELMSPTCGGYGGELAFRFFMPEAGVTITETGTADVVLYVRDICLDETTEVACSDDPESLTVTGDPSDDYFLVVDGFGPGSLGTVELTITSP